MPAADGHIEAALKKAEDLKLFPQAAMRVRSVAGSPKSTLLDLEEAVSLDPTLSAQVLKVANSPFYGLRREVGSVQRALFVLGFDATRDMAMALTMMAMADSERPGRRGLWRHSIRVGAAAQQLGQMARDVDPREAFVTGLLHDLGKLILLEIEETTYLSMALSRSPDHIDQEQSRYGFDHALLGGRCLEIWGLPEAMCLAVRDHHLAPASDPSPMAALIHLADEMEWGLYSGAAPADLSKALGELPVCEVVGLDAGSFEAVTENLDDLVNAL